MAVRKKREQEEATRETLAAWQQKLQRNMAAYDDALCRMRERDAIYNGTAEVDGPYGENGGLGAGRQASFVYNAAYELIEGQVDSSIPMPRVSAATDACAPLAAQVEDMLRMKLDALPFEEFNDMDERNTYNQGGDFALVEWDNSVRRHTEVGDVRVSVVHPLQVIPQAGVAELADMDYVFVRLFTTRQAIQARYGKEVGRSALPEDTFDGIAAAVDVAAEERVILNIAYYKNTDGGIGRYVWANGTQLEDLHDYEARRLRRCDACGEVLAQDEEACPACGGKKASEQAEEYEELTVPACRSDGSEIPTETPVLDDDGRPMLYEVKNPDGSLQLDETGRAVLLPVLKKTRIPYYKPRCYPLLLRRNVSKYGSLLGSSDIDVIRPQQDAIKKLTAGMMEKLLKGGSYVTLPAGVKVETSDRQLKILRIENPAQKALIDVLNIQPNINFDMAALADQYEKARSALGITSSFQGKSDASATSGVAKQFAAAQTAGRLESKRRMKHAFYARLFEVMFRFMLAYTDGPVCFKARDERGNEVYTEFNRYDFLKQDEAGEWYWDDTFLFSVDATGGLAQNREGMWEEAEKKYTSGAMGDPGQDATRVLYWTLLEQLQFPLAKAVKRSIVEEGKQGFGGAEDGSGGVGLDDISGKLGAVPGGLAGLLGGAGALSGEAGAVPGFGADTAEGFGGTLGGLFANEAAAGVAGLFSPAGPGPNGPDAAGLPAATGGNSAAIPAEITRLAEQLAEQLLAEAKKTDRRM